MIDTQKDEIETESADPVPETDLVVDPAPAAGPSIDAEASTGGAPSTAPEATTPGPVPDAEAATVPAGYAEVEHDDRAAQIVVGGVAYAADEAGRFFVRTEHLAAALCHGFRAVPAHPAQ